MQIAGFENIIAILYQYSWYETITALLIISALIFILFLISGSELSFHTIPSSSYLEAAQSNDKRNKLLLRLLEKPDRLKATLIISNVFLKIAVIGIIIIWLKYAFLLNLISVWGFMIFIIILSLALYIFGEVIPKLYAQSDPYRFSIRVIYPIYLIFIIINPIVYIFTAILNLFSVGRLTSKSHLSAEDLSEAIEFASNELEDGENLFKGIVKFGNINVSEIIKPRVDVVAIEHNLLFADVFAIVVESEYSRIPVFSGNFDNIMGILYVKDLIPYLNDIDKFQWQTLVRPPYFVPETKKVKELLTEFQTNKIHMAIIVDEYGGTLGIVTLEDILEEIVGEISDESDDDEKPYSKINDNIYLFDGKTSLNDLQKILQTDSDVFDEIKGEADTLAGMIIELKGTIPSKNELIHYKQFIFKIEAVDTRRIKQIRVTIVPE